MRENSATPTDIFPGSGKNAPTSHFMVDREKGQISDPTLPIPAGAEADQWTERGVRDVFRIVGAVQTASNDVLDWPVVTVIAEQRRDGRMGVIDVDLTVVQAGLTADQARELAGLLIAGAALAEEWVR